MRRKQLRNLGAGFLSASLITGAFAVFGQGNVPVPGITVQSIFNNDAPTSEVIEPYKEEISKLQEEIAAIEKDKSALDKKIKELETKNNELNEQMNANNRTTTTQEETSQSSDQNPTNSPARTGNFTISEGQVSSDIARALEEQGYIENASELQELFANWDLDAYLQVGTYELNADMSIHQIAEIITHGAYYYIP